MGNVSADTIGKMQHYIEARNSPERLGIVEMVSQYVLSDLSPEEDKEEALILSRYHLSTDRGTEDLKALYPDAISWMEEGNS
ncbi:MAG: hypothetical protein HOI21_00390 [Bacteroidetes Order II. Incertae sedis bacterium]|jgi:hypothetical protein|nr:hypothetical protein [Bacteroidetes Order II. bacterium]